MRRKISSSGIERLALYYRYLSSLDSADSEFISSEELAKETGQTAAGVRRDLSCFGTFGTPGRGYRIGELRDRVRKILGKGTRQPVILVGVGNLGTALLSYKGFRSQCFQIVAAFDNDLRKIGKRLEDVEIQDLRDLGSVVASTGAKIAIVSVPSRAAQRVIDELASVGIQGILNFAPIQVVVPEGVKLRNVDLSIEMDRLCYLMSSSRPYGDEEVAFVDISLSDAASSDDNHQHTSETFERDGRSQAVLDFLDLQP